MGDWGGMVCVADQNGDGKMQIEEFKGLFSKITGGDMQSLIQEIAAKWDGVKCKTQSTRKSRGRKGLQPSSGSSNSVSINIILFTLASLMAIVGK